MKKQKKLKLGKIKIAGISNTHGLFGGATTQCQSTDTEPGDGGSCKCTDIYMDTCGTSTPDQTCGTTSHTRPQSDYCTVRCPDPSQNGEIC